MLDLGTFNRQDPNTSTALHAKQIPNECPQCYHNMVPAIPKLNRYIEGSTVISIMLCTNDDCRWPFFAFYEIGQGSAIVMGKLLGAGPHASRPVKHSTHITDLSKDYVEIFSQGSDALSRSLHRVAGPGFRKALEFLVKDYLIRQHPSEAQKITKQQLGPCIKMFQENTRVRSVAEGATWIGNDETHYERRWTGKDIDDLVKYIRMVEHYIEMELEAEELEKEKAQHLGQQPPNKPTP